MILYLDMYFLINAGMDALLLILTRQFLHIPAKKSRLAAASCFGGAWACLAVLLSECFMWKPRNPAGQDVVRMLEMAGQMITWVLGTAGMLVIAFGRRKIKEFLQYLAVFWIVSAAAGGIFTAAGGAADRNLMTVLLCGAGILLAGCGVSSFLREQRRIQKNLYEVTIYYQGNKETVTALRDTGNRLYEPYGHRPVHVIDQSAASRLMPVVERVIYIPFSAVGTDYGILPGVQADRMVVTKEGKTVREYEKPWLAISREPLSAGHQYEMLLHGEEQ